jgi:hypothetical protein
MKKETKLYDECRGRRVSRVLCRMSYTTQHFDQFTEQAVVSIKSYKVWKVFFYHQSLATTADNLPKMTF